MMTEGVCFRPLTQLREVALHPSTAALIVIDVQNFCCHKSSPMWKHIQEAEIEKEEPYFWKAMPQAVQNIKQLLDMFRNKGMEVLFTNIESCTKNGRDRSLDYKLSGFNVPRGSWEAKVIDEIPPLEDEICLSKTSSDTFASTNIQYVLRNLGMTQVVLVGGLTDQCVESSIRSACDSGFLVTQVTDACYTFSPDRQASSMQAIKGYCRQRTTVELLEELATLESAAAWHESGFRNGTPEAIAAEKAYPTSHADWK